MNDLESSRSFSLYAVGYRIFQITKHTCTQTIYVSGVAIDGMVESFGGYSYGFPDCVQVGQSYFAFVTWNAPQGGWAPVSLPTNLFLSTPTTISVDGSQHQAGQVIIPMGIHSISAPALVPMDSGTQLIFDHWNDGMNNPNRTLTVSGDTDLTAIYRTQYQVTMSADMQGQSGWVDQGTTLQVQLAPSDLSTLLTMLGAFKGWSVDGVVQQTNVVSVNKPANIEPVWDYTPVILLAILIIGAVITGILLLRRKQTHR